MKQLFCIVVVMIQMFLISDFLCGGEGPERVSQSSELKIADNYLRPLVDATEHNLAIMDNQSKLGKSTPVSTVVVSDAVHKNNVLDVNSLDMTDQVNLDQKNPVEGILIPEAKVVTEQTTIVNSFIPDLIHANNPKDVEQVISNLSGELEHEGLGPLSQADQKEILSTLPVKINKESSSWVAKLTQKVLDVLQKLLQEKKSDSMAISATKEQVLWLTSAQSKISPERLKDPNTNIILDEFAKLPAKARPADISAALDRMDQGEKMQDAMSSGDTVKVATFVNAINGLADTSKIMLTNLLTGNDSQGSAVEIGIQLAKKDPVQFKAVRDAYLTILVDMQWGLFKKSMVNKEGFVAGAITVVDPDGRTMATMENYVKFVNPKFNAKGLSMASITNGDAYNRSGKLSSHWKGQVVENRIYGIDVQFDGKYIQALPLNKDQLHFAQLTDHRVFVKWEYFGTTLNMQDISALKHGVTFVEDLVGPKKVASRSEAKIPQDVTAKFNDMLTQLKIKLTPAQMKVVNQQGVSGMRNIIQAKDPKYLAAFDAFLTTTKGYAQDTLGFRKANEVILGSNNNLGIVTPAQ